MKIREKIFIAFLSAIIIMSVVSTVSCSEKVNNEITPHELTQSVIHTLGINPGDIDNEYFSEAEDEYYFLTDTDMITQYPPDGELIYTVDMFEKYSVIKYRQASNETFEIGIFRVAAGNEDMINTVGDMCRARIAKIRKDIFEYNQEKAYYADSARVEVTGNYIYYVICSDTDVAYKAIETKFAE